VGMRDLSSPPIETLPVRAPFDFDLSLRFLDGFGPMEGEQGVSATHLTKATVHRGRSVAYTVWQEAEGAPLCLRIDADAPIPADTRRAVRERVAFTLGVDEDLAPFHELAGADPHFAPLARALRGLHHVKFPSPFEAACWAALNQRVPLAVARGMKQALTRRLGGVVVLGGLPYWAFPEARAVAASDAGELAALLKNARKTQAVLAIARAFAAVDERFLNEAPLDEVERWLLAIHGVGPFTASFVLFRGLGRFRGQPLHPGLLAAAGRVYGRTLSADGFHQLSRAFGPWGGYFALYLWASTYLLPQRQAASTAPISRAMTD